MDTKGAEAEYLRSLIELRGHDALLLDVSPIGETLGRADISSVEIASKAGRSPSELTASGVRGDAIAAMAEGAALTIAGLYRDGKIDGVVGLGGNQGSAIASTAMRSLPIGFPKMLVSTVASGNIRPFVGAKDIAVMFSVSDFVGGLNFVTRSVLANAAAAIVGMAESGELVSTETTGRTVAITALGNTEAAANTALELLQGAGYRVITFHASGAGGSAMEELITGGMIDAVLDLTLHELTEEVLAVGAYVPVTPGRMVPAIEKGIPVVASTGGMEYVCFGPRSSIPAELQDRVIYMHNPYNANLKINHEELVRVADALAERLNRASNNVALFVPKRAWSVYGSPGGPFFDPEGIALFVDRLKDRVRPDLIFRVLDYSINDEEFVAECVGQLRRFLEREGLDGGNGNR